MKIWIMRTRVDWHNTDPYDETTAYATENMAYNAMLKEVKKAKRYATKDLGREVAYEWDRDNSFGFATSADDYFNFWVEKISFKENK